MVLRFSMLLLSSGPLENATKPNIDNATIRGKDHKSFSYISLWPGLMSVCWGMSTQ